MFLRQQLTISNPVRRGGAGGGGGGGGGGGRWYARWRRNNNGGAGAGGTMISAKFRLKEERRRVLKLSAWKLRGVEDAESCLRRSVLIHNTLRRLQRPSGATSRPSGPRPPPSRLAAAKTHVTDDCDVQDVLSQLCGPPTPRLITTIDEESSDGCALQPPPAKRRRLCEGSAATVESDTDATEAEDTLVSDVMAPVDDEDSSQMAALWSSGAGPPSPPSSPPPPLTCARSASLLADGSSATAFGGLVASVES